MHSATQRMGSRPMTAAIVSGTCLQGPLIQGATLFPNQHLIVSAATATPLAARWTALAARFTAEL